MRSENILVTGASSGIGEALAHACVRRGAAHLFLCGRDRARLEAVAAACRAEGETDIRAEVVDVADSEAVRAWMSACDAVAPLSVVFANAGVATGRESEEHVRRTFAINVGGPLNTGLTAVALFRKRPEAKRRQLVLTASIAGYGPLPGCPAYAGTKAAVKNWGLSLRGHLRPEGIRVNVVCPGFVRSRITDVNTCPMPFFMEAPKAAEIILDRVEKNVGLIAFPWPMRFATWFLSCLPWRFAEWIGRLLPAKNRDESGSVLL